MDMISKSGIEKIKEIILKSQPHPLDDFEFELLKVYYNQLVDEFREVSKQIKIIRKILIEQNTGDLKWVKEK